MSSPTKRRPLPAVILLLALTLLTALVWWRVLHRGDGDHKSVASPCPKPSSSAVVLPRPASVSVSVLNSTTRTGLAHATAATLTRAGFQVAGYGNDAPKVHVAGVAEIRFGPAQKQDASLLAYYFPGAKMVALKADPEGKVVVSLGKKFKAVATAKSALAAMTAHHVSLAPKPNPHPSPSGSASC